MMTLGNLLNAHNEISFSSSAKDGDIKFAKNRPGFGVEGQKFTDIGLRCYLNHLLQNPFSSCWVMASSCKRRPRSCSLFSFAISDS